MRSRHLINCIDVIMGAMASQITSLTIVYSTVYSGADQRKHLSPTSPAFVRGIHRDRWIPRTNGQLRGKCFHLMTSSCLTHFFCRSVTKDKPFANLQSHENSFEELAKWSEMMTPSNGTFSALLALCAGNSPVTGEFSPQRPVTQSFDLRLKKRLSKHSWGWWFETLSCSLWRHCNEKLPWHSKLSEITLWSFIDVNHVNKTCHSACLYRNYTHDA